MIKVSIGFGKNVIYLENKEVQNSLNDLNNYCNANWDEISCVDYTKTLNNIFSFNTKEEQIERFVEQLIKGFNSIDTDFISDINYFTNKKYNINDIQENQKKDLINDIIDYIGFSKFQLDLIETCIDYFQTNVEEGF